MLADRAVVERLQNAFPLSPEGSNALPYGGLKARCLALPRALLEELVNDRVEERRVSQMRLELRPDPRLESLAEHVFRVADDALFLQAFAPGGVLGSAVVKPLPQIVVRVDAAVATPAFQEAGVGELCGPVSPLSNDSAVLLLDDPLNRLPLFPAHDRLKRQIDADDLLS